MTPNEIIYATREKLKAYTDDTKYTDSYLMYLVNLKRSVFIRREYNQLQRTIDTDVLQTICMKLEEVDSATCPECVPNECDDCSVVRTVLKLPPTIELHSRPTIVRVGTVGVFDRPFSLVNFHKMPYAGESKYEKKYVFVALHPNGHLYLKSNNTSYRSIESISLSALFENPDDAGKFNCATSICYDYDI